jgi:hypothetical protein
MYIMRDEGLHFMIGTGVEFTGVWNGWAALGAKREGRILAYSICLCVMSCYE